MFTVQDTANIYKLSVLSKEMYYHMLISETILFNDCFMFHLSIFFYYHIIFNPFFLALALALALALDYQDHATIFYSDRFL